MLPHSPYYYNIKQLSIIRS